MKLPRAHHLPAEVLAGQLIMPVLYVGYQNREAPEFRRIIRMVKQHHVGGFIFFYGHPADLRQWTSELNKVSQFPLMFGADLERGFRSVFAEGTMFPHAMALGAADDLEIAGDFADVLAREARSAGINIFFGPSLDLANDPANPIINIRAYHQSPDKVGQIAERIIKTVQKYGIACVGKHFPGHGATDRDSHTDLTALSKSLPELKKSEFQPYRNAIDADVKGLMVSHLTLPKMKLPATLSPKVNRAIIRNEWRYDGVVFTDAMDMGAVADHYSPVQLACEPLLAGADVLLMPRQVPLIHQILTRRIETDNHFRQQAEAAVERIFRLKKWLHKKMPAQNHPLRVNKWIAHPNHKGIAASAAESAITLLHQSDRFPLKLNQAKRVDHFIFTDSEFKDQPLTDFCREMRGFFDDVAIYNNPSKSSLPEKNADGNAIAVVSIYLRTFGGHVQTLDWQAINACLRHCRQTGQPLVIFLFGNPFHIDALPEDHGADALFVTYSYVQASQQAAFKALCSFIEVDGKLPIKLQNFSRAIHLPRQDYSLKQMDESEDWPAVDEVVAEAIQDEVFPGCVLLAAREGTIRYWKGYGKYAYEPDAATVTAETEYDLASVTKVAAATTAVMNLVDREMLSIEQPISDFFPELTDLAKKKITVADLLSHQGGFPAWIPFYEKLEGQQAIVRKILQTPLSYPIGEKSIYSDLGFILLGEIVERVSGRDLATFCRNHIFQPMGLTSLRFAPVKKSWSSFPPTGKDGYRENIIQGAVNDANCFALGGIAGHAGLFGDAKDVAAIGQLFLQQGIYNGRRIFSGKIIRQFSQRYNPNISARALGWDTPTENSSSGSHFSKESIGHLGFTGTSLWVDLAREIIVVLLSNRVHPDPERTGIKTVRPKIHNAVMEKLLAER